MSVWMIIGIISTFGVGFMTAWIIATIYWYKKYTIYLQNLVAEIKCFTRDACKELEQTIKESKNE